MSNNLSIRMAKLEDASEILNVYTPYILDTAITFELKPPTLLEFTNRIQSISKVYPYLVCICDQKIIGYAYASRQMSRAAYGWNAEMSVYIHKDYQNLGIASRFYSILIEFLAHQGIYNLYAGITLPNDKSILLHKKFGFTELGCYHKTGWKLGKWHDVIWLEKCLANSLSEPDEIKPIIEIDKTFIDSVMLKQKIIKL